MGTKEKSETANGYHVKRIPGGVTAPKGFYASGAAAGIKYEGRDDMALIYSDVPCEAAGVFTSNAVKAAPVKWDQKIVEKSGKARAVVTNSGVANACTGEEGYKNCEDVAKKAGEALGVSYDEVLICSTGVIGAKLPIKKMLAGVEKLAAAKSEGTEAGSSAANAILTTDTRAKEVAVTFTAGGRQVTIGGMAKGSGMIHPNMCTMLSFVTTDAAIEGDALRDAVREDVKDTYNMISVDGDTSTNDTLLVLANGLAKNEPIRPGSRDFEIFKAALREVNETLAKMIASDGEGATALLEVRVKGAADKKSARVIARSVVSSNLTKAALAGHDANWGRIICAMGYSGGDFNPEKTDIYLESAAGKIQIVKAGMGTSFNEEEATKILSADEVIVTCDLHGGDYSATAWGCDLTHGYIDINADYRS